MSPRYICKDCGYRWNDVEVKEGESTFFLRCLRCESKNIIFPKPPIRKSTKILIFFIISFILGFIGAGIGIWIPQLINWGEPWMFGLIGFLIGFLIPLYTIHESGGW